MDSWRPHFTPYSIPSPPYVCVSLLTDISCRNASQLPHLMTDFWQLPSGYPHYKVLIVIIVLLFFHWCKQKLGESCSYFKIKCFISSILLLCQDKQEITIRRSWPQNLPTMNKYGSTNTRGGTSPNFWCRGEGPACDEKMDPRKRSNNYETGN